jgi:hypothetical protein
MKKKSVFRKGMVHVQAVMCDTCIFRPGNLMQLESGRVEQLVKGASAAQSCIPCHETTHGQDPRGEAVCRGFYSLHPTLPLKLAAAMNKIKFQSNGDPTQSSRFDTSSRRLLRDRSR